MQGAVAEVQQFVVDGVPGRIVTANSHLDSALGQLATINTPLGAKELHSLREAADAYRKSMEAGVRQSAASVEQFRADAALLATRLAELTTEMAAERQRLTTLTSDFQSQFSAAQDARSTEYTTAQSARQEKFTAFVAEHTQRVADENAEFTQLHDQIHKSASDDLASLKTKQAAAAERILTEIEQHKRDVEKLVGVIGNLGVTSGFLKTANEAKITVRIWQAITVGSMIALIWVAYHAFLPIVQGTFSWEGFAGRVFFTLTIGVLAGYAGSQADKFLDSERRNRKRALELEAIGPFLAPLSPEKQEEFRMMIGERSFGGDETQYGHQGEKSPATLIDMLVKSKEFRQLATDLVKARWGGP